MPGCYRILSLICFFVFFSFQPVKAQEDNKKEKLQQLKVRLQDEIALANKILSETQKVRTSSLGEIQTVEQKLKLRRDLIRTIDRELDILDKDILKLTSEIDTLEKKIEGLKEDYAMMIRQARKSQNKYSRLMFLLSSKDFNQALRRLEYLKQYSEFRRRQVDEIKKKQAELEEKRADLSRQKDRKEALKAQMEREKNNLAAERNEQEKNIAELSKKEAEITKELKAKQAEAKKLEDEIRRIIAAEIRRAREAAVRRQIEDEAGRVGLIKGKDFTAGTSNKALEDLIKKKKAEKAAANEPVEESPAPAYDLTPEARQLAASFAANKSRLPWPVERGIVVSKFGSQRHPIAKAVIIDNNGIDIATERGGKARAVFDGEVRNLIRIQGEGIAVLVQHGDYFTLYSYLSEVFVKSGDKVKGQQELGTLVKNESEGKTQLHFEVWKGDQFLDPLPWLLAK